MNRCAKASNYKLNFSKSFKKDTQVVTCFSAGIRKERHVVGNPICLFLITLYIVLLIEI